MRVTKPHKPSSAEATASAADRGTHPRREDLPPALQRALDVAIDKNARAPVILDVTDITGYTDWVLIVSGRSDRHVAAIADGISRALKNDGLRPRGTDGFGDHTWDLLDYDDFIVHVFYHPVRMHYDLESMWSDAARAALELPTAVMDTSDLDRLDPPDSMPEYRGDLMFGGFADEFDDDHPGDEPDDDELDGQA
jgi:ribosome-associated protein